MEVPSEHVVREGPVAERPRPGEQGSHEGGFIGEASLRYVLEPRLQVHPHPKVEPLDQPPQPQSESPTGGECRGLGNHNHLRSSVTVVVEVALTADPLGRGRVASWRSIAAAPPSRHQLAAALRGSLTAASPWPRGHQVAAPTPARPRGHQVTSSRPIAGGAAPERHPVRAMHAPNASPLFRLGPDPLLAPVAVGRSRLHTAEAPTHETQTQHCHHQNQLNLLHLSSPSAPFAEAVKKSNRQPDTMPDYPKNSGHKTNVSQHIMHRITSVMALFFISTWNTTYPTEPAASATPSYQ